MVEHKISGTIEAMMMLRKDARKDLLFGLAAIWSVGRPRVGSMAFGMWTVADCALASDQGFPWSPKREGELVYWLQRDKVMRGVATSIGHGADVRKPARVRRNHVSYRPHILDYCDAKGRRADNDRIMVNISL